MPRRQGTYAPFDARDRIGAGGPWLDGHAPLQAGRHRSGIRSLLPSTGRRTQGEYQAVVRISRAGTYECWRMGALPEIGPLLPTGMSAFGPAICPCGRPLLAYSVE